MYKKRESIEERLETNVWKEMRTCGRYRHKGIHIVDHQSATNNESMWLGHLKML